ncbi:alpha/beta hydrolase [Chromobacterium phragmitis]|uniref:alpha/beta hydrolase n=1 Tax=Chromobacterium phragmitis TaxID=2202141 RepID=UPI0011AEB491|nr:alpha/beta hydrolase [Chromobacterium phragmitis]
MSGKVYEKILTVKNNHDIKEIKITFPKVVVFFVGGAGDKRPYGGSGPNGNVTVVLDKFTKQFSSEIKDGKILASRSDTYLGYYEVYGDNRIQKNVISKLAGKDQSIVIVGHSLGGWNGSWLADKLSAQGYKVELLITLDPVGVGYFVRKISDIYNDVPAVEARYWVNLGYTRNDLEIDNLVANAGGRFDPKGRRRPLPNDPDINDGVDVDHAYTLTAMQVITSKGVTAWKILEDTVKSCL